MTQRPASGRPPLAEITFVSPAARTVLATDPATLLGDYTRWLTLVHPDDQEVVQAALAQLGREDRPVTCEYRLTLLNGKEGLPAPMRWMRDTLAPQYSAAGELEGWDGVLSDITVQRALADDLRRTTSMLHALIANLPAGVFFVQGQAGLPILVNARARQLLGQPEDALAGVDRLAAVYRLCRPDGTPYSTDDLPVTAALRRGVTGMRDDIVVHHPDGRCVPLIAWAAPINLGNQAQQHDAAVWVFEDLSALRGRGGPARERSRSAARAAAGADRPGGQRHRARLQQPADRGPDTGRAGAE